MLHQAACVFAALALSCFAAGTFAASANVDQLQQTFLQPPDNARPMVRWWWFGPAVTKEGITRELKAMKAGGFGGVEVQPTYPLAVDGGTDGNAIHNIKFMSPEFLDMLGFASAQCKALGLRMDLTLGSGWPYGGPMFSADEGAGRLETQVVHAAAATKHVAAPALKPGRRLIAAFAGPAGSVGTGRARFGGGAGERGGEGDATALREVTITDGTAQLPADFSGGDVVFFISGRTGMQVKRPAFGAEGNVIDHLSGTVVDKFIHDIAEPEIKACGDNPPYAVFCDSLEVGGENWTDDFLTEFQKRRGYDLTPYLPALIGNIGDKTEQVRYDFGRTVTDLFNENFNGRFKALAHQYGTRFRIQGYGSPAAGLLSYAFADLPEGEMQSKFDFHEFRATRYAASASHLMNVPVTSAETFTWLHTAPFRAVPVDFKGEVNQHFLDGVNQIICHGWPYTGNGAAYPGWSFYAAAAVDDKNPWYVGMPDVTGYIQRVSALLREGTPANDVALYLPDSDVWAHADVRFSSLNAAFTNDSDILRLLVDVGYNVDAWDDGMLAMKGKVDGDSLTFGDVKYRVVVLPHVTYMPLETARALEAFAKSGGLVVATQTIPSKVPGLQATANDRAELQAIMDRLFKQGGAAADKALGVYLPTPITENMQLRPAKLYEAISPRLQPDAVIMGEGASAVGVVHRHTGGGEVYFVANTSNEPVSVDVRFRETGMEPELWNPMTEKIAPLPLLPTKDGVAGTTTALDLAPYGSTFVVWTHRTLPAETPASAAPADGNAVDLSASWTVTFASGPGGSGKTVKMNHLTSWTDLPDMNNYSGVATYTRTFTAAADMAKQALVLAFGPSIPAPRTDRGNGFAAEIAAPVRDAAVVYVNGKRAGAAWCPPYQVDVTGLLKEGENTLRIEVGNTAVNYLAKAGFPNYDLAAVRHVYKNRFDPQGLQLYAKPLLSGLLGPITLQPAK